MEIIMNDFSASACLPQRDARGHKGTFGRAFAYVGSKKFPGAAHLALEAMLSGGCGYTEIAGEAELVGSLISKFPEAIYNVLPPTEELASGDIEAVCKKSASAGATLIGSGSDTSEALAKLTMRLFAVDTDAPIVVDADALNSIAKYSNPEEAIREAKRPVIITPHEMEFSRISKIPLDKIHGDRSGVAVEFARNNGCTVVLKGHGTVITDGKKIFVNPTGGSALAKGGSGDALAGLLTSLLCFSHTSATDTAALACFIHGEAGDELAEVYSDYGVTPSDLPKQMATVMKRLSEIKI